MIVGENGIFTKAQEAKKAQTIAEANEKIGTEILAAQMEAIERNEELEQSQLEDIISKYGELQEDGDTIILKDNGYYTTESKLKIENENIIGDYNSGRFRFCSMNDNNYLGYIGYTELNVKDYSTLTVNVTSTYNISKVLIRKNDGSTKLLEVTTTGVLDVSEYDEIQITAVVSNPNVQGTITGTYTLTK